MKLSAEVTIERIINVDNFVAKLVIVNCFCLLEKRIRMTCLIKICTFFTRLIQLIQSTSYGILLLVIIYIKKLEIAYTYMNDVPRF